MPPLADLQQDLARTIMAGTAPVAWFAGRIPPAEALAVHRGTIMGVLTNALRLTYPTVEALVGEKFFDRAASIFAQENLPTRAWLAAYGENFADFLQDFAPAAALPYLADVALLDRAIETALRARAKCRRFALDPGIAIAVPESLGVLPLTYPADEIRAGLGDDAAMAAIDITPAERFVLVWRKGQEAAVRRVDAAPGRFLMALLAGADAGAALEAAMAGISEARAMAAIQRDIFTASFCTVISTTREFLP